MHAHSIHSVDQDGPFGVSSAIRDITSEPESLQADDVSITTMTLSNIAEFAADNETVTI